MVKERVTKRLRMRDVSYLKPKGFQNHVTITELERIIDRDVSWIRKLERAGRIPTATRRQVGVLSVRLWSPAQVEEIKLIVSKIKRGRPSK